MKKKIKPVYRNTTRGRIQICEKGIPIWLNPGDEVVGDKYKIYESLGLELINKKALMEKEQLKSPVKMRHDPEKKVVKIDASDDVVISDGLEIGVDPNKSMDLDEAEPELAIDVVDTPDEPEEDSEDVEEDDLTTEEEEIVKNDVEHLSGDELIDALVEDLGSNVTEPEDDEDSPVVILDDEEPEQEDEVEDATFSEDDEDTHPHKCEECGQGFASTRGLKSHMRRH